MRRALWALLLGAAGAGIAAFAEPPPKAPAAAAPPVVPAPGE